MQLAKERRAFDRDLNSSKSELFLEVREFILKNIDEVYEDCKEHITSYKTILGMYCYLKVKENYLHIGWGRGAKLEDIYGVLIGDGSVVRGQKIEKLNPQTKKILKDFIHQTTIILIEHNELNNLKKSK